MLKNPIQIEPGMNFIEHQRHYFLTDMQNMGNQVHCKGHYVEEYHVMTCIQATVVDDIVFKMTHGDLKLYRPSFWG